MNKLKTPVLLIVFNRPDTTPLVFEKIRQAKPPRLYIAGDGPRDDNDGDKEKIAKVREISTNVDWPCEVKTLFSDKNLGCKEGVSSAITWFFKNEEQGIILEDDCVPHLDFFTFCENLLDYYSNDERVSVITGNNFQNGKLRGDASYYFSKFNHVWGWASWRRSWKHYQDDISFWPDWQKSSHWLKYIPNKVERTYWEKIFNKIYLNPKYVWDYYWAASVWYKNGLTITPNVNLVSNIGFGDHATHTKDKNSKFSNMSVNSLGNLTHPKKVERNYLADSLTFEYLKLLNIFTER